MNDQLQSIAREARAYVIQHGRGIVGPRLAHERPPDRISVGEQSPGVWDGRWCAVWDGPLDKYLIVLGRLGGESLRIIYGAPMPRPVGGQWAEYLRSVSHWKRAIPYTPEARSGPAGGKAHKPHYKSVPPVSFDKSSPWPD